MGNMGLRAIQRLNLALFIHTDDQRVIRRIHIETDVGGRGFLVRLRTGAMKQQGP